MQLGGGGVMLFAYVIPRRTGSEATPKQAGTEGSCSKSLTEYRQGRYPAFGAIYESFGSTTKF